MLEITPNLSTYPGFTKLVTVVVYLQHFRQYLLNSPLTDHGTLAAVQRALETACKMVGETLRL